MQVEVITNYMFLYVFSVAKISIDATNVVEKRKIILN